MSLEPIFKLFRKPEITTVALEELKEAQRNLLIAQSSAEYYKAMIVYRSDQIRRLTNFIETNKS